MITDPTPIPGREAVLTVPAHMSTVRINRLIRSTINLCLASAVKVGAPYSPLIGAMPDVRREPRQSINSRIVPARYVHGFGTDLRTTFVADYTPTTREVTVVFPANYRGIDHVSTDEWVRVRVIMWDTLLDVLIKSGAEPLTVEDGDEEVMAFLSRKS